MLFALAIDELAMFGSPWAAAEIAYHALRVTQTPRTRAQILVSPAGIAKVYSRTWLDSTRRRATLQCQL